MSFLYNFAQSQEDERTEAVALHLGAGDRVLSIASAGDMPLSLAALAPCQITAIDNDPAQLALTALKLAAVQAMARTDAIGFLGYVPMAPEQRKAHYASLRPLLTTARQSFWDKGQQALGAGAIWAGRFEQYMKWLRRLVVPLLGRRNIEGLFACGTLDEQAAHFDRAINRPALRRIFRFAFEPKIFSGRGMDPRSLAHRASAVPLGDQYFGWFRTFCTATHAHENYFLQLALLGRSLDHDAVPAYLTKTGFTSLQTRPESVTLHQGDVAAYLQAAPPGSFVKAHLSNLCDWMEQDSFEQVMRLLAEKCAPGGRAVWRYLHVDRALPPELAGRVVQERALGEELRRRDRYPFYTIVPAQVGVDAAPFVAESRPSLALV